MTEVWSEENGTGEKAVEGREIDEKRDCNAATQNTEPAEMNPKMADGVVTVARRGNKPFKGKLKGKRLEAENERAKENNCEGNRNSEKEREGRKQKTNKQVGVFNDEGRLNNMHVDAVNEHFERGAMSSRRMEDVIEKLLRYDDGLTSRIRQKLHEKGYAQIPICDGVHWRLMLFTETDTDELTEELRKALQEWTIRHIDSRGYAGGGLQMLTERHQYDGYNCGIWVLYVGRMWREWHAGGKETDWRREMERLSSKNGNELQVTMNRERREYRPVVYREIMRNRETAMEAGTPGEVVIIEPVRPNESDATPREATGDIQPTRQGKQKGLHDTFLHELKKGKAKRTMEEIPNTKQQERETSRHERTGIQTDLRMYMNPAGEVRRKPRKDGGPDEPMPEREPEEENVDPRTAASEEGGRMKDANGDMAHRSEKLRMQMPITEKWEETTVLTEPERYKLNALTWNIQGNGEALYDLEPALEEWDINLAILTEIKSASKNPTWYYTSQGTSTYTYSEYTTPRTAKKWKQGEE
eukprot:gene3223-4067_t